MLPGARMRQPINFLASAQSYVIRYSRMGGISSFTEPIAEEILDKLTLGWPLRRICSQDGMPAASTVVGWTEKYDDFRERYARARTLGLDALAEEIIDISDDGSADMMTRYREDGSEYQAVDAEHINRSRLRVDARKWLLSKMRPDKYGDRTVLAGDKDSPLEVHTPGIEMLTARIDSLIARQRKSGTAPESDG